MIEEVLTERMRIFMTIWLLLPADLPQRIRRGPFQVKILRDCNIPLTGVNKGLVNAAMTERGYRQTRIHGDRYYSLSK
jgi:hypothetical protein